MENHAEKDRVVEEILTPKQLQYIQSQVSKPGSKIIGYQLRTATDEGIAGFLGDHFRMILSVKEGDVVRRFNLFMKTLPMANKPKADFISENQFFEKEARIFKLLEEIKKVEYSKPWCTRALICSDKAIVMPDLSIQGYKTHPTEKYFDRNHVFATISSLARFHATVANYFTGRMNKSHPDNFLEEYNIFIEKPHWEPSWLKAAATLTKCLLKEFSTKSTRHCENFDDKWWQLYVEGSEGPSMAEDTVNVLIHKDLWANNILFQYRNEVPTSAVLIDFQLVRYAPPAFDVMSFLYMTTSRRFRDCSEKEVLQHYFAVFLENVDELTNVRLKDSNYDLRAFSAWCERARLYGLVQASAILPYVLMEPTRAQQTFDDPDTFMEYLDRDRSEPVIAYAREDNRYLRRQLEVCEEIVDKYVSQT